MSNKNRIKTYFGSQTSDDYELAGVYPIVLENTQSLIENNNIQGKGAIALNYNSQLVVEDLKCDNKDYTIKAIKNCWISYKDLDTKSAYLNCNSLINLPKPIFHVDKLKRTGGIVTFQSTVVDRISDNRPHRLRDVINAAVTSGDITSWSTHLINDNRY